MPANNQNLASNIRCTSRYIHTKQLQPELLKPTNITVEPRFCDRRASARFFSSQKATFFCWRGSQRHIAIGKFDQRPTHRAARKPAAANKTTNNSNNATSHFDILRSDNFKCRGLRRTRHRNQRRQRNVRLQTRVSRRRCRNRCRHQLRRQPLQRGALIQLQSFRR